MSENRGSDLAMIGASYRADRFPGNAETSRQPGQNDLRLNEHGRGRLADTPSEIPARGWKDIVLRVYHNIGEDRVVLLAAGVTFYCVLALFPAIAALVALYGLFADPATIADHISRLSGTLPEGMTTVVGDEIKRIASQGNNTLGVTFLTGLAVALWSANAGMKSLFDALNSVYKERERRGFMKLNAVALLFTVASLCFIMLAIAAAVLLPVIVKYIGMSGAPDLAARILPWPILLLVLTFGLSCLYRYGPSRDTAKWRWVTWGSAAAAVTWIAASILFSWYASHFGSYNKTYGTLGAMIGFMIWIWLSAIVILLGAEVNAETEHQTARDSTAGARKPMGARGARMADSLGPAHS